MTLKETIFFLSLASLLGAMAVFSFMGFIGKTL